MILPRPLAFRIPLMALAAVLALGACSRRPPPAPPPTIVEIEGVPGMNAGGNAAIVRFYLLASDAAFRRTPIQAFWQDDVAALGGDLVAPAREVLLYPGDAETLDLDPAAEVAFLGVAADLRDPDPNGWRAVFPISDVRGHTLRVRVDSTRLDARLVGP